MKEKQLLKKLGEETLYSAKGHFKSSDLRRIQTKGTIIACMILNVLGIIGLSQSIDKWISAVGLLGTMLLLYWDAEEGKNYRSRQKEVGEAYLALHKEIRSCYCLSSCDMLEVEALSNKVIELDRSDKPEIQFFARLWAKRAIEVDGETDNWFLKK